MVRFDEAWAKAVQGKSYAQPPPTPLQLEIARLERQADSSPEHNITSQQAQKAKRVQPATLPKEASEIVRDATIYKFTLPYPPSVGRLWATLPNGKRIKTERGKQYIKDAHAAIDFGRVPFTTPVGIRWKAYRPRRIGDVDNLNKSLLDAMSNEYDKETGELLEPWVYADDELVKELHCFMFDDKDNPRVEVEVWEL